MSYKYLQERPHYEDSYDRFTVERCRWHEEPHPISNKEVLNSELSPARIQWCHDLVSDWTIFQLAGDRYLQREESITQSMERDSRRDERIEQARPPMVSCPSCSNRMECTYTHLRSDFETDKEWIEFVMRCQSCKEGKWVHENGSEVIRKPILCDKCNHETKRTTKMKKGKEYIVRTCTHCGHAEEYLSYVHEEDEKPTQEEIERYEYDKKRFCLTREQGERYRAWKEQMKNLDVEKKEQEANAEFYDKLAEVKKLNIAGLEKLIKPALKKAGYSDFHMTMMPSSPQIIVSFSVRDTDEKREDYDSRKTLEKTIEKVLEEKNWALTSEGVTYRLGMLDGRLRGYDSEEDLQQLTKSRMKKMGKLVKLSKPKSARYASMFPDDMKL